MRIDSAKEHRNQTKRIENTISNILASCKSLPGITLHTVCIQSYAFSKSILKTTPNLLDAWTHWQPYQPLTQHLKFVVLEQVKGKLSYRPPLNQKF